MRFKYILLTISERSLLLSIWDVSLKWTYLSVLKMVKQHTQQALPLPQPDPLTPHFRTYLWQALRISTSTLFGSRKEQILSAGLRRAINDESELEETYPSMLAPQMGGFRRTFPRIHQGFSHLLKRTRLLALFSPIHTPIPLTMLSRITSQATYLCWTPCHRICFGGT